MAEIPLLPLPLVLFPGGRLPLQIFEARYLDMIKRCMREDAGFGIVMIEEGEQTLASRDQQLPSVARQGTYATIVDFDQNPNGTLGILVEGQVKFVIRDEYELADRLMMAQVEFLPVEEASQVPQELTHLVELLEKFLDHDAVTGLGLNVNFENAVEVGARLTELLPCPGHFKQRMLELKNPMLRLKEVDKLVIRMQKAQ